MGVKFTFDLITGSWGKDGDETDEDIARQVEQLLALPDASTVNGESLDRSQSDAVFAQSYIPRQLVEVYDAERDVAAVLSGKGEDLIYASTSGLAPNKSSKADDIVTCDNEEVPSDEESSEEDAESRFDKRPRGKKFEDKADKKDRKQAVKDEKKEKRKTKMPKSEKRRRVAKGSGKK